MDEECEICGERHAAFVVLIEGAKMQACADCARRGKILSGIAEAPRHVGHAGHPAPGRAPTARLEKELVSDYADRIRNARLKMKVGADVIADMVFEKQSYIDRIEAEKALPTEALAKRLEKALGITLFEEGGFSPSGSASAGKKAGGTTLGDLVVVKKKKEER